MDLNRVTIIGNVSKDPETKTLTTGSKVTRVNVATGYAWKDASSGEKKDKVDFHTVVGWNKLAEHMGKYLKRGSRVYFEGRLDNRSFEGKDGVTKYYTDVVAQRMIMLGKPTKQRVAAAADAETDNGATEEDPF